MLILNKALIGLDLSQKLRVAKSATAASWSKKGGL
jgi:hypothetical protein